MSKNTSDPKAKGQYKGQCLCGGIQYEADQIDAKIGHCHCTMCRKFHGAAFSTFGTTPVSAFRWLKGEELLSTFTANNGTKRKFCQCCGSSLVFEPAKQNDLIEFALATLDQAPSLSPDAHIFTNTKVDWINIDADGLPKYRNGRH